MDVATAVGQTRELDVAGLLTLWHLAQSKLALSWFFSG
jgi:hypothetical protein